MHIHTQKHTPSCKYTQTEATTYTRNDNDSEGGCKTIWRKMKNFANNSFCCKKKNSREKNKTNKKKRIKTALSHKITYTQRKRDTTVIQWCNDGIATAPPTTTTIICLDCFWWVFLRAFWTMRLSYLTRVCSIFFSFFFRSYCVCVCVFVFHRNKTYFLSVLFVTIW